MKRNKIMKITERLERLPKGEVVVDKRILFALKRAGLIYGYSPWGYLESQNVYYLDDLYGDGKMTREHRFTYMGPEIKPGDRGSWENPYESHDEYLTAKWQSYIYGMEYKGFKFESKYLSGCFNAYLVKQDGPCVTDEVVSRSMSLWGAVI